MILLLILLVLLAIAGKMFLGMALEVAGALIGLVIVFLVYVIKRRNQK